MAEKTRYSDEELEEFREIINEKLALAKRDYDMMMKTLTATTIKLIDIYNYMSIVFSLIIIRHKCSMANENDYNLYYCWLC